MRSFFQCKIAANVHLFTIYYSIHPLFLKLGKACSIENWKSIYFWPQTSYFVERFTLTLFKHWILTSRQIFLGNVTHFFNSFLNVLRSPFFIICIFILIPHLREGEFGILSSLTSLTFSTVKNWKSEESIWNVKRDVELYLYLMEIKLQPTIFSWSNLDATWFLSV